MIRVTDSGDYQLRLTLPFFEAEKHKLRLRITIDKLVAPEHSQLFSPQLSHFEYFSVRHKLLGGDDLQVSNNQHKQVSTKLWLTDFNFKSLETYRFSIEYQVVIEDNITFPIHQLQNDDSQVTNLKVKKRWQYNVHRLETNSTTCLHSKAWYAVKPITLHRDRQDINKIIDNLPSNK